MKVTNWDMERLLAAKVEIFSNKKLPIKLVYWLARLKKDIEARFKEYADARIALFEQYCIKDESGVVKYGSNGEFQFSSEATEKVAKELNELRLIEIEIGPYDKLKFDLNDKSLEGTLSPNDLAVLGPFIEIIEPNN